MTLFLILALAGALAMDAFAVAVAQGAARRVTFANALQIGVAFGVAQGIMPWIGYLIGAAFLVQMAAIDHWVVLVLMVFIGGNMIKDAMHADEQGEKKKLAGWALLMAALATSIDALAAGITLPTFGLPLVLSCLVIAAVTAILSFGGVYIGNIASKHIGKFAEVAGGVVLIGLGLNIFIDHQFFGG